MPFIPFGRAFSAAALGLMISTAAQAQVTDCAAPDSYTPPPEGTVFRFEIIQDGSPLNVQILNRIGESDGAETHWQRQYQAMLEALSENEGLYPPDEVTTLAGLFDLSNEPSQQDDGFRRYAFRDDPVEALLSLEPGEATTINRAETSAMHNRTRTIRGPFVLAFEGCDTIDVAGEDHPVRLYRLESDARSYRPGRRPEADTVVTTVRTVALSMEYGWVVRVESDTTTTHVIEITPPAASGDAGTD